jgi:hypothetical protein
LISTLDSLGAVLTKFEVWAASPQRCTVMLIEVCNYFVTNLLCKTIGFVDGK